MITLKRLKIISVIGKYKLKKNKFVTHSEISLLTVEMLAKQFLQYLPFLISGWQLCFCVVTYTIAVYTKHVYYMFPYISDTGATPPESNIFGQCLNIGAVMMLIALYIRYKQIDYDIRTKNITLNPIWNKIGIIFGIIACLGMSVVGNFPELTLLIVHLVGALMAFGVGILYLYVQTWISSFYLNARQRKISKALFYMRLFMVCLLMPLMISIFVFGYLSFINFHGKSYLLWTEEDGGYGYRLVSVFSEWFLYILVFVYIATFSTEFGNIKSTSVVLQFKEDP